MVTTKVYLYGTFFIIWQGSNNSSSYASSGGIIAMLFFEWQMMCVICHGHYRVLIFMDAVNEIALLTISSRSRRNIQYQGEIRSPFTPVVCGVEHVVSAVRRETSHRKYEFGERVEWLSSAEWGHTGSLLATPHVNVGTFAFLSFGVPRMTSAKKVWVGKVGQPPPPEEFRHGAPRIWGQTPLFLLKGEPCVN